LTGTRLGATPEENRESCNRVEVSRTNICESIPNDREFRAAQQHHLPGMLERKSGAIVNISFFGQSRCDGGIADLTYSLDPILILLGPCNHELYRIGWKGQ